MKGSKEGGDIMKESSFLKLILISFFIDCVAQHSNEILKISKYNKTSLESSCQQRYVDESDSLVYLAVLQTSHLNMSQLYVAHFQMEQPLSQSFEQMCSVKVWNSSCESDHSKSNCYCQSNDDGVLSLILNMTANLEHSERTLQFILSNATSGDWNMTAETKLPKVYSPVNLTLLINGQSQDKYMCNITKPTEIRDVEITWCVQSVLNYTLHISTRSSTILNSSFNGCVMYTLTPAVLFENVIVSYIEVDDCQRHQSYRCNIYSRDNQNSCVDMCQDVVLTHVVIIIIVILISSVCILITLKDNGTPINPLLIVLFVSVIAQIILVIIAATSIEYTGDTALHIWKIMAIYQSATYLLFIIIEFVLLCTHTKIDRYCIDEPWVYLIILICIQSLVGSVCLPFIIKYLMKKKPEKDIELTYIGRRQ